jgi:cytoskeletal protein CcmA (bactofilin family)
MENLSDIVKGVIKMRGWRYIGIPILTATLFFSLMTKETEATQIINGDPHPAVAAGTVINDDLVILGGSDVVIDGTVNGDVFIFAQRATIRGTIQGDVFAAVQNIEVDGRIEDDARIVAQNVRINGKIKRNLWAAAQDVTIYRNGDVGRNASVASELMTLVGIIQGNLDGAMQSLYIQGTLGGTGKINVKDILLGSEGKLGGDLLYTSPNPVVIEPGGQIVGRTERTESPPPKEWQTYQKKHARGLGFIWPLLSFFGGLIIWAVWKRLLPTSWFAWQQNINEEPGKSALIGLILIGGIPIISLLILITIVGIPLAMMTMFVYGFIYYLSHLVAGSVLGTYLYKRLGWQENNWVFPLGYSVISLLSIVPFLGFFIHVAVFALGLGSLFIKFFSGKPI